MNWEQAKVELRKGLRVNRESLMQKQKISDDVTYMGTEAVALFHGMNEEMVSVRVLVGADTKFPFVLEREDYEANDWVVV